MAEPHDQERLTKEAEKLRLECERLGLALAEFDEVIKQLCEAMHRVRVANMKRL
jgi:hypothetical protein